MMCLNSYASIYCKAFPFRQSGVAGMEHLAYDPDDPSFNKHASERIARALEMKRMGSTFREPQHRNFDPSFLRA
eukprot:2571643-Alexandrium_andersonii.AAC.1